MKCYGMTAQQGAVLNQDTMTFKDKIIMKRHFKKHRIVEENIHNVEGKKSKLHNMEDGNIGDSHTLTPQYDDEIITDQGPKEWQMNMEAIHILDWNSDNKCIERDFFHYHKYNRGSEYLVALSQFKTITSHEYLHPDEAKLHISLAYIIKDTPQ